MSDAKYQSVGAIFKDKEHLLTTEMMEVINLLNDKLKLAQGYRRKYIALEDVIHESFFNSEIFLLEGGISKEDCLKRIMDHLEDSESSEDL